MDMKNFLLLLMTVTHTMFIVTAVKQEHTTECDNYGSNIAISTLIIDYVRWRKIDQVAIVDFKSVRCETVVERQLFVELNRHGVAVSFQTRANLNFEISLHRVGVVVRLDEIMDIEKIYETLMGHENRFTESYIWLFIVNQEFEDFFLTRFCQLPLRFDSDIYFASINKYQIGKQPIVNISEMLNRPRMIEIETNTILKTINLYGVDNEVVAVKRKFEVIPIQKSSFSLNQIYKIRSDNDSSCISTEMGQQGINGIYAYKPFIVENRKMLQFPLIVSGLNYTKYMENNLEDFSSEKFAFDYFTGYLLDVLDASLMKLEFNSIGAINGKNERSGVLGSVASKESDIAVSNIEFTFQRAIYVRFTNPIQIIYRSIYLRQPESSSIRDIFMSPFTPFLLVTVILSCICMSLLLKMSYKLTEDDQFGWSDCALWCAGILFMQGSICIPKSTPSLGIVIVALLFGLIVYNAYSASITSTLSIQFQEINSLSDLFATDFSTGFVDSGSTLQFLNGTDVNILKELYRRSRSEKVSKNLVRNNIEGLEKVLRSRHGHFGTQTHIRKTIYLLQKKDQCDVSEVKELSAMTKIVFPMPFGSPYRKVFEISLLRMKERGVLDKIHKLILPELPHCGGPSVFDSAKLLDVVTAFGLMLLGIGTAIILLLFEIIWRRQRSGRPVNNSLKQE